MPARSQSRDRKKFKKRMAKAHRGEGQDWNAKKYADHNTAHQVSKLKRKEGTE